ncbi:hypothetical protein ACJIZ3_004792 [Penstemon smallii]|uniref:Uncharacterized protein n=1 Tax=Penstemon smallii TaxID=265156 RepID=A0ABD3S3B9_9LAMI
MNSKLGSSLQSLLLDQSHVGFNPFRGGLGTLSGYLSQHGFEPESATL